MYVCISIYIYKYYTDCHMIEKEHVKSPRTETEVRQTKRDSLTVKSRTFQTFIPIASMYGIFTYIWLKFMANVGKYTIHGCYGYW